jgi:dihydroneopterin aldolase
MRDTREGVSFMKGRYAVRGMSFHAFHGVLEVERELGQVFSVDVEMDFDLSPGDEDSNAEPIVKEADVYEITRNVMTETKFRSVTSLAAKISLDLLGAYARAKNATVSITREQLFIAGNVDNVKTEVSRGREDIRK